MVEERTGTPGLELESDELIELVNILRQNDYNVGTEQYIAAHKLVVTLAAHGRLPQDAQGLRPLLAPLLCSSAKEQENFEEFFNQWLSRKFRQSEEQAPLKANSGRRKIENYLSYRITLPQLVVLSISLIILGIIIYASFRSGPQQGGDTSGPVTNAPLSVSTILVSVFLIILADWLFMRMDNHRARLKKLRTTQYLQLEQIPVKRAEVKPYQSPGFRRTLQELRHHHPEPSTSLDMAATINATALKAGYFMPVYGTENRIPEYLLLIDRANYRDHQAHLGDEFFARLVESGIPVRRYYFSGDPRICQQEHPLEPHIVLGDLAAQYPDHYLLLFSDGAGLIDPIKGRPQRWVELFSGWTKRSLLTPVGSNGWEYLECFLQDSGFTVLPASSDGIAALVKSFGTGNPPEIKSQESTREFPTIISDSPDRWLVEIKPDPDTVKILCFQLRLFLGSSGYIWFSACAIYPALLWELTLYLGHDLVKPKEFEPALLALVQLPWFRQGVMPDWLRTQLVSDLSPKQERPIRKLLEDLLSSHPEQTQDQFELSVSPGIENLQTALKTDPESTLYDYVLLTFMHGIKPDKLAVAVPDDINSLLYSLAEAEWNLYVGTLLVRAVFTFNAVIILGLVMILLVMAPRDGLIFGVITSPWLIISSYALFQIPGWGVQAIGPSAKRLLKNLKELIRSIGININVSKSEGEANPYYIETEEDTLQDKADIGGHPAGLTTLFLIVTGERFSYYGMRAILVLYMVAPLELGGLGFDTARATSIYGTYTMSVYLSALLGGWIADRFLGARVAVLWGGILIACASFSMVFTSLASFYAGLVLVVAGTGLLKPNISNMVGKLYSEDDPRRDSGFSIFYLGINIGAMVGPVVCGYLGQMINWHLGFAAAGVGIILSLIQYVAHRKRLAHIGEKPGSQKANEPSLPIQPFTIEEIKKLLLIGLFFIFSMVFWMVFEQAGSSLTFFADRHTDNSIFGFSFPSAWFQSLNPLFIIVLAPLFSWLWIRMRHRQPSSPTKFSIGLIFVGVGALVLALGATFIGTGKINPMWLISFYFLQTIGELCLSPVGLSTTTRLAPVRIAGLVMGIWFLSVAFGNRLAGWAAGFYKDDPWTMFRLFGLLGATAILAGLSLAVMIPYIRKLAASKSYIEHSYVEAGAGSARKQGKVA
jgi:POT family proton-dependent oligopeptide transporter